MWEGERWHIAPARDALQRKLDRQLTQRTALEAQNDSVQTALKAQSEQPTDEWCPWRAAVVCDCISPFLLL